MKMEWILGAVVVAALGYFVYKMMNDNRIFDLNKDGKIDAADAKVVVEKVKKNVKKGATKVAAKAEKNITKAVNKTATKVANKTAPKKAK